MTPHRLIKIAATGAAVAGLTVAVASSGAEPAAHDAGKAKITRRGVDGVKLHMKYRTLRKRHLVHKIRHGCELGGQNTREARLVKPMKGIVAFSLHKPRRAKVVTIRGGAEARGVGIHDSLADIME